MYEGDAIGLLGIELHTRRRNRVNGIIGPSDNYAIHFDVDQSFGNCPRYIQLRDYEFVRDPRELFTGNIEEKAEIDATARRMIEAADMFFVASYVERESRRQVDVSSRGGNPGFVRVADDGTLTIPDFAGNLFFATLGNILINGKAGLLFVDFETGDVLQMTGDARVIPGLPGDRRLPGRRAPLAIQGAACRSSTRCPVPALGVPAGRMGSEHAS